MVRSDALKAPISTRLVPVIQMSANKVLTKVTKVTKVLQSNENIPFNQSFTIDIVPVRQPTGSGKTKNCTSLKVLDYSKDSLVKKSVITIRYRDKLKQFKQGAAIQKIVALELYKKANILRGPCGLREVSKFQGVLSEYQITVIDFNARNTVIYEGPRGSKKIVLYKNGDLFNVKSEQTPCFPRETIFPSKM